jgi:hypothetical protein
LYDLWDFRSACIDSRTIIAFTAASNFLRVFIMPLVLKKGQLQTMLAARPRRKVAICVVPW